MEAFGWLTWWFSFKFSLPKPCWLRLSIINICWVCINCRAPLSFSPMLVCHSVFNALALGFQSVWKCGTWGLVSVTSYTKLKWTQGGRAPDQSWPSRQSPGLFRRNSAERLLYRVRSEFSSEHRLLPALLSWGFLVTLNFGWEGWSRGRDKETSSLAPRGFSRED